MTAPLSERQVAQQRVIDGSVFKDPESQLHYCVFCGQTTATNRMTHTYDCPVAVFIRDAERRQQGEVH